MEETGKKNYLNQDKRIMIIYCTRTHSQIAQVIKEIREKLAYEIQVIPLASRKHMCIFGENYDEHSIDQVCKLAREKNQKFMKKKFQAILNADKVNFRGHQKALLRIMDGTSKSKDCKKSKVKEEDLRKYEEQVFIDNIVEGTNFRNKKDLFKDFQYLRTKA